MKQTSHAFYRSLVKALMIYGAALLAALSISSLARAAEVGESPLPEGAQPMSFSKACVAGSRLTIAAVGDVLPHEALAEQAYRSKQGFGSLWAQLTPYLQSADMAYANLEGPAAEGVAEGGRLVQDPGPVLDRVVYTGTHFMFNYNPRIVSDLKDSGFDILSIANNHALDRASIGVQRTIEAMNDRAMQFSGSSSALSTVVERSGFRVAWIACTDVWNQRDGDHLITACGDSNVVREISRLKQDPSIDAVIVAPHWGEENHHQASNRQRSLARKWVEGGAIAVIGSHPHVLQEVETIRTRDGRDTVVAYSLGNFVSWQGKWPGLKTTLLLVIGLTRPQAGGPVVLNGVTYLPLWMDRGPNSINVAELSKQAPHQLVTEMVSRLADPSRQLRAQLPLSTSPECGR